MITFLVARFKNVISPGCHGRWTRVDAWESCPCKEGPHFIFVWIDHWYLSELIFNISLKAVLERRGRYSYLSELIIDICLNWSLIFVWTDIQHFLESCPCKEGPHFIFVWIDIQLFFESCPWKEGLQLIFVWIDQCYLSEFVIRKAVCAFHICLNNPLSRNRDRSMISYKSHVKLSRNEIQIIPLTVISGQIEIELEIQHTKIICSVSVSETTFLLKVTF